MRKGILTQKGQAVTEMAIFGSLILMCFAVLLSYAQTFTEQQTIQQQAFRKALRRAYDANGMASNTIMKHHRTPNIFGNFGQGNRESVSGSSSVYWSKGGTDNEQGYLINEDLLSISTHTEEINGEDEQVPNEVWNIESRADTYYSGEEGKQENAARITTSRRGDIRDTITTTLKLRHKNNSGVYVDDNDITITQGLCADGRYRQSCAGNTIERERAWETPH